MHQKSEKISAEWIAKTTAAGRAIIRINCTSTKAGESLARLPYINYALEIISGGNLGHPAGSNCVFPLYHVKLDYTPADPVKSAASLEYNYVGEVTDGEIKGFAPNFNPILSAYWSEKPSLWGSEREVVITAPHPLAPTALMLAPLYGFATGVMAHRINDRHGGKGPSDLETAFARFVAFVYATYRTWGLL